MSDMHRHDLSDEKWLRLKPHLPGSQGNRGRRGKTLLHGNGLLIA